MVLVASDGRALLCEARVDDTETDLEVLHVTAEGGVKVQTSSTSASGCRLRAEGGVPCALGAILHRCAAQMCVSILFGDWGSSLPSGRSQFCGGPRVVTACRWSNGCHGHLLLVHQSGLGSFGGFPDG